MLFEDYYETPLENNSITYNEIPVLETTFANKRWPVGALSLLEMQVKTTWRFHLTEVKITKGTRKTDSKNFKNGTGNPYSLFMGLQIGPSTVYFNVGKSQKVEYKKTPM